MTVAAETTVLCTSNTATRGRVRRGTTVGWTIVVHNCGEHVASGILVTDRVAAGATVRTRGGATLAGRELSWRVDRLAPGARATFRITTRLRRTARIARYVNKATANGANTAPATGQASIAVLSR